MTPRFLLCLKSSTILHPILVVHNHLCDGHLWDVNITIVDFIVKEYSCELCPTGWILDSI